MELNPGGVSLKNDEFLYKCFRGIFDKDKFREIFGMSYFKPVTSVIETGPYLGEGITKIAAEAIIATYPVPLEVAAIVPNRFNYWGLEINYKNYKTFKKNYGTSMCYWIRPKFASSVNFEKAKRFLETDEFMINHEKYDGIYIDSFDPIGFYKNELFGDHTISKTGRRPEDDIMEKIIRKCSWGRKRYESKRSNRILFILDSCGGIGWLEFQEICNYMGKRSFYCLINGINHVKHYRSYKTMQENGKWRILAVREGQWALGYHIWSGFHNRFDHNPITPS